MRLFQKVLRAHPIQPFEWSRLVGGRRGIRLKADGLLTRSLISNYDRVDKAASDPAKARTRTIDFMVIRSGDTTRPSDRHPPGIFGARTSAAV